MRTKFCENENVITEIEKRNDEKRISKKDLKFLIRTLFIMGPHKFGARPKNITHQSHEE